MKQVNQSSPLIYILFLYYPKFRQAPLLVPELVGSSTHDAGASGSDLLLHPLDELQVALHQPLLGLDFGDDLTLCGEGREGRVFIERSQFVPMNVGWPFPEVRV